MVMAIAMVAISTDSGSINSKGASFLASII